MELKMVKISPEVAAEMLESNININRSIKQGHLTKLIYDMSHGFWDANNGEALRFTKPKKGQKWGTLVDGQHRLHAIISSGTTFTLPCMIGVSEDSFATLDSGSSRQFGDILASKGVPSKTATAGAVLTLEQFYCGNFAARQLSHSRLLKRYEGHTAISDFAKNQAALRILFRPSEAIFLAYCFNMIAPKKGAVFMHQLRFGGAPENSPQHLLREKLISYRIKRPTGYIYTSKDHIIGSVFKCWNLIERKSSEPFEMLKIGEDIEYPIGFAKFFTDIEVGGIER